MCLVVKSLDIFLLAVSSLKSQFMPSNLDDCLNNQLHLQHPPQKKKRLASPQGQGGRASNIKRSKVNNSVNKPTEEQSCATDNMDEDDVPLA